MSRTIRTLTAFAASSMLAASIASAQSAVPAPSASPAAPAAAPAIIAPPADIDIGMMAPDFTIDWADANGPGAKPIKLSELRGKVVVLAFYPADHSSGCTAQLTKFRDEYATMFGSKTVLLPISKDSVSTHAGWAQELKFPFLLASDPDLELAKKYGSYVPGRTYANRTVFVIGKDGRILWRNLKFGALTESAYTELAAEVAKAQ